MLDPIVDCGNWRASRCLGRTVIWTLITTWHSRSHLILAICHLSRRSTVKTLSVFFSHLSLSLSPFHLETGQLLLDQWASVSHCCCHGDECRATHAQHTLIISVTWPVRAKSRDLTARLQWRLAPHSFNGNYPAALTAAYWTAPLSRSPSSLALLPPTNTTPNRAHPAKLFAGPARQS